MPTHPFVAAVLARLRELRENAGITTEQLERQLILGPGWIARYESGEAIPSFDVLLAILHLLDTDFDTLTAGLDSRGDGSPSEIDRRIDAEQDGTSLKIHFQYAKHDAEYVLPNATVEQFEDVLRVLRDGLARLNAVAAADDEEEAADDDATKAIKTDSVAKAFLRAMQLWPHANPSDIWWFVISRAYGDPFNHPAQYSRLDLGQSWKRTGGWALEEILVRHYGPHLRTKGINLFIASPARKRALLAPLPRIEADKADVLLSGEIDGAELCFGVVHVKASFAERRTDDVPMSRTLVEAGYTSPLWTFDCKSGPAVRPVNRGELGDVLDPGILGMAPRDRRSAKRKDIEDDGFFSGCFSYNRNTKPTPAAQAGARAKIVVCDFSNSDDAFGRFIESEWERFRRNRPRH